MPDEQGTYYAAKSTDCMSSIATDFGFFWRTLWMHPKNQQLRKVRKNPNVLMEDDQVFIPPKELRNESRSTDSKHKFVRKGIPTLLRMRFMESGRPRANTPYVLTIDSTLFNGSTDGDGKIELPIPSNALKGVLVLGQGKAAKTYNLNLGHLSPVSEPIGAIQRLNSLGYHCGLDPETGLADALSSFQANNDLPTSGELDAATQAKLSSVFGG